MAYANLSKAELQKVFDELSAEYKGYQAKNLALNMARGKPSAKQLELALGVLEALKARSEFANSNGDDCRNYGLWDGLPEMKRIFADMVGVPASQVILGNNSSLMMMFEVISRGFSHGYNGCTPWCKLDKKKFLCPVPGYDRHFAICQHFGIEMICVPMNQDGPDMDLVEKLVSEDDSIKGIWCVPKFSNPNGLTYSDEVVRRFANLAPKAPDFRIFWDDAYFVHELTDEKVKLLNLFEEAKKTGKEDMVFVFCSTSKISYPGSGLAAMGASFHNIQNIKMQMAVQTIGNDKMNQLRHVRFFGNKQGVSEHMKKHAELIRPKFQLVERILEEELGFCGIARWTNPKGGYFISLDTQPGCAKRVISLCRQAGVAMTPAGSTYPYGMDPEDSNIRIAPTYPTLEELEPATKILCLCIKIATIEKMIAQASEQETAPQNAYAIAQ